MLHAADSASESDSEAETSFSSSSFSVAKEFKGSTVLLTGVTGKICMSAGAHTTSWLSPAACCRLHRSSDPGAAAASVP